MRERPHDIEVLIDYYLAHYCDCYGVEAALSDEARNRLLAYPWPGNVRQLKNLIEALVAVCKPRVIQADELDRFLEASPRSMGFSSRISPDTVESALRQAKGNKSDAAKRLGVSRQTLYRWLRDRS